MKILTVDIGTGTQDIFLYDSRLDIENGFKLVVPSPTMMVRRRIQEATRRGQPVLLTGVIMGGGPSAWAAEDHIKAGLPLYATPEAARTFNDDLEAVRQMGVWIVSEDEPARLPDDVLRLELRDFDFPAISSALEIFGVSLDDLDAVAVSVFDHGDSPPGYSDRQFRFDYLDERIRRENRLSAFAWRAGEIPPIMTRLRAVEASARGVDAPLVVMDTAPAAVLGATFDPRLAARPRKLIANVGNFHTLAFRLGPGSISYFIRRRYREPLYDTVLERYLQLITRNGVTQGIFLEGWTREAVEASEGSHGSRLLAAVFRIRTLLLQRLDAAMPPAEAGLLKATVLGDRSGLTPDMNRVFLDSGTYHILAISGLNVSLLAGTLFGLFRLLRVSTRLAAGAAAVLVTFYAALAGASASVIRAAVMADVYLLAIVLDRRGDLLNSLALSGLAILWWNPRFLQDVGFQLTGQG